MARRQIQSETRRQVLHEAGYRCANPVCRMVLAINLHHLDQVSEGGDNSLNNLIALCPNCHALHHQGNIPYESLRTWKTLLVGLNEAFDKKSIDILLALRKISKITLRGEGMLDIAGLIASDLVEWRQQHSDIFDIKLSKKGDIFVQGWVSGNLQKALSINEILNTKQLK